MLANSMFRPSLCSSIRFRSHFLVARKVSSNPNEWEDNRSSRNSKALPFFLGAATIGMGAVSAIYFNYPEMFRYFYASSDKTPAGSEPRSSSHDSKPGAAAQKVNQLEQDIRNVLESNSRLCAKLDSFVDELQKTTVEVLAKIGESAVEDISTETFLQLFYKIFTSSTQLLVLWKTTLFYSQILKKVTIQKGDIDPSLRSEVLASREKLISIWLEFLDIFSSLSFPPMEQAKMKEYWEKYSINSSKDPDYETARKSFMESILHMSEPADEEESELRDKIGEVFNKLQQLEYLLIERFEQKGTSPAPQVTTEAVNTDEQSIIDRGTLDEIVKSKVEEEKEKFEIEFNLKIAEEKERLNIQLGEEFNDKLQTMKVEYALKLAETLAKLHAIESAVDEKASSQKRALFSHYMWLACESLRSQLFRDVELGFCSERATELDKLLKPLHQFIRKIELVNSEENNPFVSSILASVPEKARTRGVYTEEMLKLRFNRVIKTCYRLADVNETRNSVYAYMLSYVKSALTVHKTKDVPQEIDLESVDNYSLLQYAECALERGDIGTCVKILNHLKGKPAEVVHDWLSEARLFLETKQAAHCLSLFSTATGFSAAPLA